MTDRHARTVGAVASLLVAALFAVVCTNSRSWIGRTFPGFFLMRNRVVPSVVLPEWDGEPVSMLFQSEVIAVDGQPVKTAAAVYAQVRQAPAGTRIHYTARKTTGELISVTVPSRRFTGGDYVFTIGALTVTGLLFAAIGLGAFLLKPDGPATIALLGACVSTGIFAITAGDLYGPHWFFRLHVLAETFMAPAFIHLALAFPTDRFGRHRRTILLAVYLPFVGLGVFYEWALVIPSAYTAAHLMATAAWGLACAVLVVCLIIDFFRTPAPLVRRRVAVVALGTLIGVVLPGVLMATSAAFGGKVPVNAGVLTAFLFPLSVSYAVLKHDLFEIDRMLRRTMTYAVVVLVITGAYLGALVLIGAMAPTHDLLAQSSATHAVLNLGLLLLVAPTREKVQRQVDRVFFRSGYNAEDLLAELSQRLATARAMDEVIAHAIHSAQESLGTGAIAVFERQDHTRFRYAGGTQADMDEIALPDDLAARIARGEVLTRYEWEDGSGRAVPDLWRRDAGEIIVPMRVAKVVVAIMMLGTKGCGRAYTLHDVAFLRTLANQLVLAMSNAAAFAQIAKLNSSLERQVRDRTAALESANLELNDSLGKLQHAYELLERNQASLLRADRLATLGRLAAGLAHEINTPLGAVLNSLKIVRDLAREYGDSIGDPTVLPEDHTEIAAEILATADAADAWARKAAAFLARTKLHGRELQPDVSRVFPLRTVIDETCALLAHRLHAAGCSVDYSEEPQGIVLQGDPNRLSQVMVNLVANAVDAYEDHDVKDCVRISARQEGGYVLLSVEDLAGGIPATALPHIFEELFTTKEPGRGTGLGLWIARNLIEQSFQGTLTVDSQPGVGTAFTLRLPRDCQEKSPEAGDALYAATN